MIVIINFNLLVSWSRAILWITSSKVKSRVISTTAVSDLKWWIQLTIYLTLNSVGAHHYKYWCESCQKNFKQNFNLQRQQKQVHENFKFICNECGKQYSCGSALSTHQNKHHKAWMTTTLTNILSLLFLFNALQYINKVLS